MTYALSSAQMKRIDQRAIHEFGLPARILMENAGKGCADFLLEQFPEACKGKVIILHGSGNNSGDGFVIARYLAIAGVDIALFKLQDGSFSPESQANYQLCEKLGIISFDLSESYELEWLSRHLDPASMIIDAVFGIGFKGELNPRPSEVFGKVATCKALRIAIDIPSGINADTGTGDDAFPADLTLCIHAPKQGSLLHVGKQKSGTLHIIPIGIPCSYDLAENPTIWIHESCHETPMRFSSAHKGMYGRVLVIGGSAGYLGSVAMASRAALRAGAGFVNLLSRKTLEAFYCSNPAEIMFIPIPETEQNALSDSAQLLPILNKADSILIGPGLGLDAFAKQLLEIVLQNTKVPTIIDADALRLIAGNAKLRKHLKKSNILLTPHYAEFCALAGVAMPELLNNILLCLSNFVAKYKAQVLLKGDSTLYQDSTRAYLNTSGNDGLATGGSGDVLGGIIASFAAQGMQLSKAAINASYLMGKTAEQLAQKRATPSILPTDIIENLFVGKNL